MVTIKCTLSSNRILLVFNAIQFISFKYDGLVFYGIFILLNSMVFLIHISKVIFFGTKRIQLNQFLLIPHKISGLSNVSMLFLKNQLIFINKLAKKIGSLIFLSSSIVISLKIFEILSRHKQHNQPYQQISAFKINEKYSINQMISPTWLKDKAILWGVSFGCVDENLDQGCSYSQNDIGISQCSFSRSSEYAYSGGVIYISCVDCYSMKINYSMFYNCIAAEEGGAIYFYSHKSSLKCICANRCSVSSGHFAFFSSYQTNQVEYLSVSNCSHTPSGYYPISITADNQRVDNINNSMNNAVEVSGIFIGSGGSLSFSSSLCTFSNNKASYGTCIFFHAYSGTISMSSANIVHNNSPNIGVICVQGGSKKMIYCIFQNNQDFLFSVREGSLEVSHSFIDHSESFSIHTAVSTTNNSLTNRLTYQIQFFNSLHCNANISLPQRTFEKSSLRTIDQTGRETQKETIYADLE